jgi:hypothetical protein
VAKGQRTRLDILEDLAKSLQSYRSACKARERESEKFAAKSMSREKWLAGSADFFEVITELEESIDVLLKELGSL